MRWVVVWLTDADRDRFDKIVSTSEGAL